MDDLGDDAIDSGMSLNEFGKLILREIDNSEPLSTGKAPMINLRSSDETYSISNAIKRMYKSKEKGIEHEISQDYQRNQELKNEHGVIVPTEAILGQRTMTVGNLAGNVSSISDASKLIPFVQRTGVYSSMGLTEFAGFSSDVKVPEELQQLHHLSYR